MTSGLTRRDETTQANEAMDREINKGGGSRSANNEKGRQPDAADIQEKSVANANDAAFVRRPYP